MKADFPISKGFRIGLLICCFLGIGRMTQGAGVVTTCDETSLRAAMAGGGVVRFGCSGTLTLSQTLNVTQDTVLDASDQEVILDGSDEVQLLIVTGGARLTLVHLTLARGAAVASNEAATAAAAIALGGAVLVDKGQLVATRCVFLGNKARGGQRASPVVGGAAKGGAIYVRSGTAELSGCDFRENQALGGPIVSGPSLISDFGEAWGGAICLEGGTLRLSETRFESNQGVGASAPLGGFGIGGSAYGGAIFSANGSVEAQGCEFVANQIRPGGAPRSSRAGTGGGGAVFLRATITNASFASCEFVSNVCHGGSALLGNADAMGGAVFSAGTLNCSRSNFRGNQAGVLGAHAKGGAVYSSGTLTLAESWFVGNEVRGGFGGGPAGDPGFSGSGGALYAGGATRVEACAFDQNKAAGGDGDSIPGHIFSHGGSGHGGAIFADRSLEISNSVFSRNTALGGSAFMRFDLRPGVGFGGGLYVSRGPFRGAHLTFAGNSADAGADVEGQLQAVGRAAGAGLFSTNGAPMTLVNSIVAESSAAGGCYGAFTTSRNNLSADDSCGFAQGGGWDGRDPKLGALSDVRNPTPFIPLLADSPAIDAGDVSECAATDQRGVTRPYGPKCDLGAYEWNGLFSLRGAVRGLPDPASARVLVTGREIGVSAQGDYAVADLPAGLVRIAVVAPGQNLWPPSAELTLGPGDGRQDFAAYALNSLGMERAGNGRITCRYSGPISSVGVLEVSSDLLGWAAAASVTTDAQGWWSTNLTLDAVPAFFRVRR